MARQIVWNALVIVCTSLGLISTPAFASNLTLTPVVAEILQADLTPFAEGENPGIHSLHCVPLTLKVDYYVSVSDLQSEIGFGNIVFNLDTFRLSQNEMAPGWQPDVSTVDANGDLPLGVQPKWEFNGELGPPGNDLTSLYVGLFPRDFGPSGVDPRWRIAQDEPAFIGSVYVNWNGARPALLRSYMIPVVDGFSTYAEDRMLAVSPGRKRLGGVQLGHGDDHLVMKALDWAGLRWNDPTRLEQTFPVDTSRVRVSVSGDAEFSTEWIGGPAIAGLGSDFSRDQSLMFVMDFTDASHAVSASIDFSSVVGDVEFSLLDINLGLPNEGNAGFIDQVEVFGYLNGMIVMPSILDMDGTELPGNVITGTVESTLATNVVRFDQEIDQVFLRYGNAAGAPADPGLQMIGIGDIYFTTPNPEPGSIVLAVIGAAGLALLSVVRRRRHRC